MNVSPIVVGVAMVAILAVTVFLAYLIARRQQGALKMERKPIRPLSVIFTAALVTTMAYIGAVISAILMLVSPFVNLNLAASVDDTTNLLVTLFIVLALVGTGLYWLFVRLGLFSWKVFNPDY
jgi:flagellar biogenesis protein FliO